MAPPASLRSVGHPRRISEDTPSDGLGRKPCGQCHLSHFTTKAGEKSGLSFVLASVLLLLLTGLNLTDRHGILQMHRDMPPEIIHLTALGRDTELGDLVLWLGYLGDWEWGDHTRDVSPGIRERSVGYKLSFLFVPTRTFSTLELLRYSRAMKLVVNQILSTGRIVWVSLARCTREETIESAHYFHPPSAVAISELLTDFRLSPTGIECLWVLQPTQHIVPPIEEPEVSTD